MFFVLDAHQITKTLHSKFVGEPWIFYYSVFLLLLLKGRGLEHLVLKNLVRPGPRELLDCGHQGLVLDVGGWRFKLNHPSVPEFSCKGMGRQLTLIWALCLTSHQNWLLESGVANWVWSMNNGDLNSLANSWLSSLVISTFIDCWVLWWFLRLLTVDFVQRWDYGRTTREIS